MMSNTIKNRVFFGWLTPWIIALALVVLVVDLKPGVAVELGNDAMKRCCESVNGTLPGVKAVFSEQENGYSCNLTCEDETPNCDLQGASKAYRKCENALEMEVFENIIFGSD